MTLSRPGQSASSSHNHRPPNATKKRVRFVEPDAQEQRPFSINIHFPETMRRPPITTPPKSWLQQYWEEFKITNWWATYVITQLFQGSAEPGTDNRNTNKD